MSCCPTVYHGEALAKHMVTVYGMVGAMVGATTILDFRKHLHSWPKRSIPTDNRYMLLKFGEICFILCENYKKNWNSRWRSPPSWIWENMLIWPKRLILASTRCSLLKFHQNCFIHAEVISIFRNPRWRPPPSWILENLHIWPKGSVLAGSRCLLLNFGENCFIHAEVINNL